MSSKIKIGVGDIVQTNNVCIGLYAGSDLTDECNVFIIGDNVRSLDRSQENVVFLGKNIAIGKNLFGKPIELFEVLLALSLQECPHK